MSAEVLALGASHKTASLELRERLALPAGRAIAVLRELTGHDSIHEAVAISTCNRTELHLVAEDSLEAENATLSILSRQAEVRPTELVGSMYSLRGDDAVRHLFSVAAGLDSMIVGEAEVQGQVKRSYELALGEGTTGPISNRLFRSALATGKRVRTETGVGRSHASVSTVAVELAAGAVGDLTKKRVLVIGAGENGELTAQALLQRGVHTVFVANRRYDRAIGLAQRFGGTAVRFEDLPAELAKADIVVSCTSSPHQIFGREELEVVLEERGRHPLVLIDIAVPRDIEPSVRDLCSGITLFDMDDLQREVDKNLSGREAETDKARSLVEEEAGHFERWLETLDVVPTIAALRDLGEQIVEQVLRENQSRWESLSEADRERLGVMARAVVNRLLHEPTLRLKAAAGEESLIQLGAVRELFGLELETPEEAPQAEVADLDARRRRRT